MPNVGAPVIRVGPQGAQGSTGAPGAAIPAADGNVNGRQNNLWVPALPLTGGAMTGQLSFGQRVVGSPTDVSQHIDLWGGAYGFNVTGGTLNSVSGGRHAFLVGGTVWGQVSNWQYGFRADGQRIQWNNTNG